MKSISNSSQPRECAYCGAPNPTTRDHVVPRGLFAEPRPDNLITVRACESCNGTKSKLDEAFRDILITDYFGSQSPVATRIREQKLDSSVRKNRSWVVRKFLRESRRMPLLTPSGIYYDDVFAVAFDPAKIDPLFRFFVQGLFYSLKNQRLPSECNFTCKRILNHNVPKTCDTFNQYNAAVPIRLMQDNEEVFSCACLTGADQLTTLWLFAFYSRVFYLSTSKPLRPKDPDPRLPTDEF